ncbi:10405_t:CDS:2, partial [Scutellospora calospora]
IFTETHPELVTLNTNILELQKENNNNDNILISELFYNIDNNVVSEIQINYFYKIFNQKSEFFVENFDKKQKELIEQDINTFCLRFDSFKYCSTLEYTKKIIDREVAIKKWKNIQILSKNEKNILLLGILNAFVRKENITEHGTKKKYLTNEYFFNEDHIVQKHFY